MLDVITPVVLTFNEEANIGRSLQGVVWARDIVLVDSGSTDGTLEIARRFPQVRIFVQPFTSHADQWNFAVSKTGIRSDWVLALDADYIVTPELRHELSGLLPDQNLEGYRAPFIYCVLGRPLRASLYPPVIVLYRRELGSYVQDGHTQRLQLRGDAGNLNSAVLHDDRKPLMRWLAAQSHYMRQETDKLVLTPWAKLGWTARVRRAIVPMPFLTLVYCLFVKGLILDGWPGLFYSLQRMTAEAILSLHLLSRLLARAGGPKNEESS